MDKRLHFLFDPLCGWCYGATPAMSELLDVPGVTVALLPTGLFSGERARSMDDAFATSAWSNDRGIERLAGQRFTEQYRHRVLGNRQQRFDSGPATVALTAVSLTDPGRELEALKALQHARYVDGGDVTSPATVAGVLHDLDLEPPPRLSRIRMRAFSPPIEPHRSRAVVDAGVRRARRTYLDCGIRREAVDGESQRRLFQSACTDKRVGSRLSCA